MEVTFTPESNDELLWLRRINNQQTLKKLSGVPLISNCHRTKVSQKIGEARDRRQQTRDERWETGGKRLEMRDSGIYYCFLCNN